jgi:hypothetical protein
MDRIKSRNCGSRAWSDVILSQTKELKTIRNTRCFASLKMTFELIKNFSTACC